MKPGQNAQSDSPVRILAFGAHPDDIEFGCGGVIVSETQAGQSAHLVVCSHGEAGSYGTPQQREIEARDAATILGASIEFIELDGDAHLEIRAAHAIQLAAIIRRLRPAVVLAPSLVQNQHPDHWRLGMLVRDACRLARYGGIDELRDQPAHKIEQLFFYALGPDNEPRDISPILIDISASAVIDAWKSAMAAHASQTTAKAYIDLQLSRAKLNGLRCGVGYAVPLYPNDPVVVSSLSVLAKGAAKF
jgi:LmbE family N-acetylglucosaminyl deacetylase